MRRYLGFIVSTVLSFVLVAAMFALKPDIKIKETRDSLATASDELASYPFTPLISDLRVFSGSWKTWVDEIDTAFRKKKRGEYYGDPQKQVDGHADIFRKGRDKIDAKLVTMSISIVAGPLIFWLALLLGVKLFPKVEHLRYVAGRVALLAFAGVLLGIALPVIVAEDITGLPFSIPTIVGGIVGWVTVRKSAAQPA